jgi:hypothetical protein
MFQSLQQGATLYILYKNEPRVETGRVISVNTHMPQYNPAQPMGMLNGLVTDISVTVGPDTLPFASLPASASVANFNDKGIFISEDKGLLINELTSMRDNSQRVVDSYEAHKNLRDKCDELLISLNPDKQKELAQAKEMSDLRGELAEMKRMLSAVLGTKKEETI